ncbi:MAG: histidine phosphatase family protein [Bifidobacteriaceae bacterium]|jgi:probable phosphoglycerate mutase|nr:histidine phosphatase family protein [Bifidobacteriaceae bacterium]
MTARHLVIWRHGQTEYNLQGRIQGAADVPLDQVGLGQAADAAARLALLRPAAIWSSDLARAAATAAALASLTDLEVVADARLREREFGQWEGLAVAEVAAGWPVLHQRWRAGEDLPEIGMETRDHAAARFAACALEAAVGAPDGSTAVLATHGGVAVCGITRLLELDPVHWLGLRVMRNAHWAVLEGGGRRPPAWRLTGYDLGDLSGRAGLTPWA